MPPVLIPTVVTGWDVEQAVFETLKPRLDLYCPQLNYPTPKSYMRVPIFDRWPEHKLPGVVIASPGLGSTPTKMRGGYYAHWAIGVAYVVSGRTEDSARKQAKEVGALIRAILVQEPSLHGFARGTDWVDETYDELPIRMRRNMSSAEETFSVEVGPVVDPGELPLMVGGPMPTPSDVDVASFLVTVGPKEEVIP